MLRGRSPTSFPRTPGRARPPTSRRRRRAREAARPDAPGRLAVAGYPTTRLPGGLRPARRDRRQRLLRLVPRARRQHLRPHQALAPTSTSCASCYPKQALMVTEFGAEANRDGPVGGEGHLRLPAGLRQLPPRRLRAQAVAQRRGLLGAQRVPGPPGLGRRQPAPGTPPLHQKGLLALRRPLTQARVGGPAARLRDGAPVRAALG